MTPSPCRAARLALLLAAGSSLAAAAVHVVAPASVLNAGLGAPPSATAGASALAAPPAPVPALPASVLTRAVPAGDPDLAPSPRSPESLVAVPLEGAAASDVPDRAEGDARAFDGGVDVLRSERRTFSAEDLARVQEVNLALTAAVREAAEEVLGGKTPAEVVSRGSTSRGTHFKSNPDYDLSVKLPSSWSAAEFKSFLDARSDEFRVALSRSISRAGERLFPATFSRVSAEGPIELTDAGTGLASPGVALFRANVYAGRSGQYVQVDVTLTNSEVYANPYPEYFAAQMSQVAARDGAAAAGRLLDDIRLAKRFFKESIGAYKFYEGGPSAVGIEQMVMQSGRVSDSDRGRTVLETGSFDKMMARIDAAAYGQNGSPRTFGEFQAAWTVHNAFMRPANVLSLIGPNWKRVAAAARRYAEARLAGRPTSFKRLGARRGAGGPGSGPRRKIVVRLQRGAGMKVAEKYLTSQFETRAALKTRGARLTHERDGKGGVSVTLEVPDAADVRSLERWIEDFFRSRTLVVTVVSIEHFDPQGARVVFAGPTAPTASVSAAPAAPVAGAPAAAGSRKESWPARIARRVAAFLRAWWDRARAARSGKPGALTLGMLERFATSGPSPRERGEAYLYAQGAQVLPPGLEAAWAARAVEPLPSGPGVKVVRTYLRRDSDRAFVMVPAFSENGRPFERRMPVGDALAQGVVSDAFVEIAYDDRGPRGLRSIGAYPQDMMIGRVARRGGTLLLEGLFREDGGRTSSLYEPLTLAGGVAAGEGRIVQAFVRPAAPAGYEAVPMMDLGEAITPEIAAREIALRRGARGYFDEAVVRQAEAAGRAEDPAGDYARIKAGFAPGDGRVEDLRALPFVTIDPPGAGDLDDAYQIERLPDGGYSWLLATADVAHYVRPGTPAFRAAARIGNTFYSIDKDGVGEYPMNHPVVSKSLASLLDGKDSLAMITRMRFDADGNFLPDRSEVFLGLVRVKGRYTYDQVAALWRGEGGHGVEHVDQVSLARELSAKLARLDGKRGKLNLGLGAAESVKIDGTWARRKVVEDPLRDESHRLIEELKVYGNRAIAARLTRISRERGAPHISRVHPAQAERAVETLKGNLAKIGAPWNAGTLSEYLDSLHDRKELSPEQRQAAQWMALASLQSASYAVDDDSGHEGLALKAGAYDHPSAPIRRFSDMYNRALLEASLEGGDPKAVYAATLADLKSLGFESLDDYLAHLNGRERAARQMGREIDAFMSLVELGRPENAGKTFRGHVRFVREGRDPSATIELEGSAATVVLAGPRAAGYRPLDAVDVTVRGVDLAARRLDALVVKRGRTEPRRGP